MTDRRDLKRRVRERQARTGESYMAALHHIRGEREAPIPVVDLIDLSEIAAALGLKCRAMVLPALAARVDVAAMLRQLHATLVAELRDPGARLMRSVVLHGMRPFPSGPTIDEGIEFMRRMRAGITGFSDGGWMLSLAVAGRSVRELVTCFLWMTLVHYVEVPPTLIITTPGGMFGDDWESLRMLRIPARGLP
jgi:hypothetical protein